MGRGTKGGEFISCHKGATPYPVMEGGLTRLVIR